MKRGHAGIAVVLLAFSSCAPARPKEWAQGSVLTTFSEPVQREDTWHLGSSWIQDRGRNETLLARFEGDPYSLGFSFGRLTREKIRAQESHLDRLFRALVPSGLARWGIRQGSAFRLRHMDRVIQPDLLLSIAGLADGYEPEPPASGWPAYRRMLSLHALHEVSQRYVDAPALGSACTGFLASGAATKGGHLLLARNFDFEGGDIFDRQKLVSIVVPSGGIPYLSVGFPGMLGVVSGLNREGIGVALHAVAGGQTAGSGTPMTLLMADVLGHDATFDAAVERIRRAKVFVSDLILVGDGKTGTMAVLEKTPSGFGIRTPEGLSWIAAANETSTDLRVRHRQPRTSTSKPRLARLESLLRKMSSSGSLLDAPSAVAILRDRQSASGADLGPGNRNAIDGLIAAHSVVFDLTARRAWVAAAPHTLGAYSAVDLDAVLSGRDGPPPRTDSDRVPADPWLSDGTWDRYCAARKLVLEARRLAKDKGKAGGLEPARAKAEEAHRLSPTFVDATALLGELEARAENRGRARNLLDEALAHDPSPPPLRDAVQKLRDAVSTNAPLPKSSLPFVLEPDELIEKAREHREK